MDQKKAQQKIEQPAQPSPSGIDARIFTMPEQYRHGAQHTLHEPAAKPVQPTAVSVQAPTPPAPKAPPRAILAKKQMGTSKKLLLLGTAFVLLLGIGGFLTVFFSTRETTPPPVASIVVPVSPPPPASSAQEPEEESTQEPEGEPDVFEVDVVPGTDSDSDGLTDTEENLVYDTDSRLPDTDADGFLDGNEVFHRYNPGGTAPGTLLESGLVKAFSGVGQVPPYEFYYPSVWEVEQTQAGLVLDAQTGEGFRVSFVQKAPSQTLEAWADQELQLEDPVEGVTKNGLPVLQTQNQLTAYVDLSNAVMVVEYDTGIKARVDYLQTFQMMLNSIQLMGEDEGV